MFAVEVSGHYDGGECRKDLIHVGSVDWCRWGEVCGDKQQLFIVV